MSVAPVREAPFWQEVAAQLWAITRAERNALHGPRGSCSTRLVPYGPHDPYAKYVHADCAAVGCLDYLHELLANTMNRLNGRDLSGVANVQRYISQIAEHEMAEIKRRRRVALGFPAKPSRSDGVPAKVIMALRSRFDGIELEWALCLFRILRSYPYKEGRVSAAWPLDGLTLEKNSLDHGVRDIGSEGSRTEIRHDIDAILTIAIEAAGRTWVYDNIVSPMHTFRDAEPLPESLAS